MNKTLSLKSAIVLAALCLSAGMASAEEGKQCFEDGLKNNYSTPVPNISLQHESGGEHRFSGKHESENEHHFGGKHDRDMFEHHGHGFGGGISVSPVSEPATDAMLLAGLVMLGTLVRRKSKSTGSGFNASFSA